MPEGSLTQNLQNLQATMNAAIDLLGVEQEGENPASGYAGAASLLTQSPQDLFDDVEKNISANFSTLLGSDLGDTFADVSNLFPALQSGFDLIPSENLQQLGDNFSSANAVFSGDGIAGIQNVITTIRQISDNIPEDRNGVIGALTEQIVSLLNQFGGKEAEDIAAWIVSIESLYSDLMPLIDVVTDTADGGAVVVDVYQRALDRTLKIVGFEKVQPIVKFANDFPPLASLQTALAPITPAVGAVSGLYSSSVAQVNSDYASFRTSIVGITRELRNLNRNIRPVVMNIRGVTESPLFQPNALENYLRAQMDKALRVNINEVQKIDDPFNALFDQLGETIDAIDLSFVRDDVLGFFDSLQDTIESVDLPSIGDVLNEQLTPVAESIHTAEQGVTDFVGEVETYFDGIQTQYCELASELGEFQPDGSFRYNFEDDLVEVFETVRNSIDGDSTNPDSFSLKGELETLNGRIEQAILQVSSLLAELDGTLGPFRDQALTSINDFTIYIDSLNMPQLLEELKTRVDEILDQLIPVDFDIVIDPVVDVLDENSEKLNSIDPSSLNEILRGALKVALEVVIHIDFTATVRSPLSEQFEEIKAIPQQGIQELQERYEEALDLLDEISPSQLLQGLFVAFDKIEESLGSISVESLLSPLDKVHEKYVLDPFDKAKPGTLLAPATEGFDDFVSVFDSIKGSEIIAPINDPLNELKDQVSDFDVTEVFDELLATITKAQNDLRDIRPSEILAPIADEFAQVERELDRFKPSVVFQPVVELAEPLLGFLEDIQQESVDALHQMFQAPLQVLDQLQPETLTQTLHDHIDELIAALRAVNVAASYNQLKGEYMDLRNAVEGTGDQDLLGLVVEADPVLFLDDMVNTYNSLITSLENLKSNIDLDGLVDVYEELQTRLMDMLPPFARELLNEESFKRIMRLANPARFLEELDARFDTLKEKVIPVRPEDISAELDESYDAVRALIDDLDLDDAINEVKDTVNRIKEIVDRIRVDFLATDIDNAVADVRAMVSALDPSRVIGQLDEIHADVGELLNQTKPSELLGGIQVIFDDINEIVDKVNPRTVLGEPIDHAWEALEGKLGEIDFTVILQPIIDKLDELEAEFFDGLQRTEGAFDQMLGAAGSALGGGGGASAGVST